MKLLAQYWNRIRPSVMNNGHYDHYSALIYVYYVEIKEDNETVSGYINDGVYPDTGSHDTIIAIPVK